MIFSYCKVFSCNFSYHFDNMNENIRFMQVVETLKEGGVVTDYVQLASILETNKAGISDIKSGRKKLSIDILRRMKLSYPLISLDWIVLGEGEPFIRENTNKTATNNDPSQFIDKITQQAEEIGRLKERIAQLEKEQQKNASGAAGGNIANAG